MTPAPARPISFAPAAQQTSTPLREALVGSGRQALTPMLAFLSARHEVQYWRLFRS